MNYIDTVSLFASPPDFAAKMNLRNSKSVVTELINNAEKSIFITCYEISYDYVADLVVNAKQRGVKVTIYIDDIEHDRISRSLKNIAKLEANGIRLVRQKKLVNHTKSIIVDRRIGIIGSANFTKSGMNHNLEIGVLIEGNTCKHYIDKFVMGLEGMS